MSNFLTRKTCFKEGGSLRTCLKALRIFYNIHKLDTNVSYGFSRVDSEAVTAFVQPLTPTLAKLSLETNMLKSKPWHSKAKQLSEGSVHGQSHEDDVFYYLVFGKWYCVLLGEIS
jgi:hypothetical protein